MGTTLDLILIFFCLLIVIAMMIFVLNPPEAWIKKVFYRKTQPKSGSDSKR